jgi:quinol monooxygenase YgiN
MSVIMTLRTKADPKAVEEWATADPGRIQEILGVARRHGLIAHRFYGSDDGQVLVIDEWPDAASFQAFFGEAESMIGPMMAAVGAGEPEISFWHKLETGDDFGWE